MISNMQSSRMNQLWPIAACLDFVVLFSFVAIGHASHGLTGGVSWYVVVLVPFVIGWYGMALLVRLYSSRSVLPVRLWASTWVAGVVISLGVRVLLTHRGIPLPFDVVAGCYIGGLTLMWRLCWIGVKRLGQHGSSTSVVSHMNTGGDDR